MIKKNFTVKKNKKILNLNKIFILKFGKVIKIFQSMIYLVELINGKIIKAKLSTKLLRKELIPNLSTKVQIKIYLNDIENNVSIVQLYKFSIDINKKNKEYLSSLE